MSETFPEYSRCVSNYTVQIIFNDFVLNFKFCVKVKKLNYN